MSLIVYRPWELVTLDIPIHMLDRQPIELDGNPVRAIACYGPYRIVAEFIAKLTKLRKVTPSDIQRICSHEITDADYTIVMQGCDPSGAKSMGWQVFKRREELAQVGLLTIAKAAMVYCTQPGKPVAGIKPPMLGGEVMSALAYSAMRSASIMSANADSHLLYSDGRVLRQMQLTHLLERYDDVTRIARTAV